MIRVRFAMVSAPVLAVCAAASLAGQETPPSLPDPRAFLAEVRENLRSDRSLLDQYTFTETLTERRLDGKGAVKSVKTSTYEVYPSPEPGTTYRRLVARDGARLSQAELSAQDRRREAKGDREARGLAREEEQKRREQAVLDELFRMDEIAVEGRDSINGRVAIVLRFAPRPGFRPTTDGGKVIRKLAGRAWIDEEDRQLVRLEASLLDSLGVGPAGVARLQKGATASFERRKINGEIWLPAEARFDGAAKVFFVFGSRIEVQSKYGDYRKFSVRTEEEVRSSH